MKKSFIKENIVVALIWNMPVFGIVLSSFNLLNLNNLSLFIQFTLTILIYIQCVFYSLYKWETNERIEKLEQKLKEKFGDSE